MGKNYNLNDAYDPSAPPVQMYSAKQRPAMSPFVGRMEDALAREREQEAILQQQNMTERDAFMASLPNNQAPPYNQYAGPRPGASVTNWLTTLSQQSPRGKRQMELNEQNDNVLRARINHLMNTEMPAEVGGIPGRGGAWKTLWLKMLNQGM